jgi:hypothetical protein
VTNLVCGLLAIGLVDPASTGCRRGGRTARGYARPSRLSTERGSLAPRSSVQAARRHGVAWRQIAGPRGARAEQHPGSRRGGRPPRVLLAHEDDKIRRGAPGKPPVADSAGTVSGGPLFDRHRQEATMNSDAMVDVDSIHARLNAITPGTWRRHGGDIFAGGDQTTPLLRGRVRTAEVRAQSDADAEFVAHAPADIAALLDQLGHTQDGGTPPQRGEKAEVAPSPQADRRRRRRRAGPREAKVAPSPQADRRRRHRQAGRDRRTVTDWLRRLPWQ